MVRNEQPPITPAVMDNLKSLVGQQAKVVCVNAEADVAFRHEVVGRLEEVTVFAGVLLTGPSEYPGVLRHEDSWSFITPGSAIISIQVPPDGEEVYFNPLIDESYDAWTEDEVDAMKRKSYGNNVVDRYWPNKTRYSHQD